MSSKTRVAAHPDHIFQDPDGPSDNDFSLPDDTSTPSRGAMAMNKRKRDTGDHDGAGSSPPATRASGAGERTTRRSSFKRASPSGGGGEHGNHLQDPSDSSFLSPHPNSSFTGAGGPSQDDLQNSSSTSLDFNAAMSQHQSNQHQSNPSDTQHLNGDQQHQQSSQQSQQPNAAEATSTAAAALAGIYTNMTVPQPTEIAFAKQPTTSNDMDSSFTMDENGNTHEVTQEYLEALARGGAAPPSSGGRDSIGAGSKPAVGSDEWHRVRRDNHKEVERRRRETINEGINELAKIVPGCEKNKGSILQRAVSFITQLKENEAQNIEKWTLEKLLTEQAIAELSASVDKLKGEVERAWREAEGWKEQALRAEGGVGGGGGEGEGEEGEG
ncbi:MAG: Carbon-nitrogen hydrolase [Chaenotheca gracillima]|nr:MAG: Carbon-nitrogen hydrolase [Chaenotheca gracillima]